MHVCVLDALLLAGRLLTALICEYLDWAQLGHTLKVYMPECNLVIMPNLVNSNAILRIFMCVWFLIFMEFFIFSQGISGKKN